MLATIHYSHQRRPRSKCQGQTGVTRSTRGRLDAVGEHAIVIFFVRQIRDTGDKAQTFGEIPVPRQIESLIRRNFWLSGSSGSQYSCLARIAVTRKQPLRLCRNSLVLERNSTFQQELWRECRRVADDCLGGVRYTSIEKLRFCNVLQATISCGETAVISTSTGLRPDI